jgi:hypothetical protein
MVEPRDAFLGSLCEFTLVLPEGGNPSEGASSPDGERKAISFVLRSLLL